MNGQLLDGSNAQTPLSRRALILGTLAGLGGAAFVGAPTAFATPSTSEFDFYVDYDAYAAEYAAAVAALSDRVPPGAALSTTPDLARPAEPVLFEPGSGTLAAHLAWLHLVEGAALSASLAGDTDGAGYWVGVAADFPRPFDQVPGAPGVPLGWEAEVLAPALAGDLSAMNAEYQAAL